jgi:ribonuclease J
MMRTAPPRKTNAYAPSNPTFVSRRDEHSNPSRDEAPRYNGGGNRGGRPDSKNLVSFNGGNIANSVISSRFNTSLLTTKSPATFDNGPVVRIIPLGGTSEVGMNMTAIECGNDIIVVDCGMGFGGGDKFPGVDYVIPDTEYLEKNLDKVRGVIFTHGHLDHIGAAPYILPKLSGVPIFGMPLTLALLKNRLQEFKLEERIIAKIIKPELALILGCFKINFFRLNHSIPDVVGLDIDTPMGRIAYCTDWKFDNTPFDGQISDYAKLANMGDDGIRLLLTDSLGVLKPGYQISEKAIGASIKKIFQECEGRIIVTSFSTTIARIQFTVDACVATDRKLSLVGRSMVTNFKTCFELGYIKVPPNLLVEMADVPKLPPNKICILSTGSQGEDMAALSRMSRDEHMQIKLQGGDSVIFTSNPIPGNEDSVADLIARLSRKGVSVYQNKEFQLHVSGHACQEDLKLLMALTKPDYLQPIHGDHYMLRKVGELGAAMGIPFNHCLIGENGRIIEMRKDEVVLTEDVITQNYILVDGTGVGAVSEAVLMERRQMSTEGTVVVTIVLNKKREVTARPEISSRGFVYIKTNKDYIDEIRNYLADELKKMSTNPNFNPNTETFFSDLRNEIKSLTTGYIAKNLEKNPIIVPVIIVV